MSAEFTVLTAGGVALAGGAARAGGIPPNALEGIIGTCALALVAAAAEQTKAAPLARAIAWLLLIVAVMRAVPAFQAAKAHRVTATAPNPNPPPKSGHYGR